MPLTSHARAVTLTLGTRSSRLARRQADEVAKRLREARPEVAWRVVAVDTVGDRDRERPIPALGEKGVFTGELEAALLAGRLDAAVHSMKDLPTAPTAGLVVAAVCSREDAGDVLISKHHATLEALPPGARVGTSSARRRAHLLAARPDLEIVPLRGNVDTRVAAALAGEYDAVVVAAAGVRRLGLDDAVRQPLGMEVMLPAPGQGALAVQCRADDATTLRLLASLDDDRARAEVTAERAFLESLGGGCAAPIAARATVSPPDGGLVLHGIVLSADGRRSVRVREEGAAGSAGEVGATAGRRALADGAGALLT